MYVYTTDPKTGIIKNVYRFLYIDVAKYLPGGNDDNEKALYEGIQEAERRVTVISIVTLYKAISKIQKNFPRRGKICWQQEGECDNKIYCRSNGGYLCSPENCPRMKPLKEEPL